MLLILAFCFVNINKIKCLVNLSFFFAQLMLANIILFEFFFIAMLHELVDFQFGYDINAATCFLPI